MSKGPKFRLMPVLRVRHNEERAAAAEAAAATRQARAAAEHADDAQAAAERFRLPPLMTKEEITRGFLYSSALTADAVRAREEAEREARLAGERQSAWTQAAQKVKALEKLQQRHNAAVAQAEAHAEERMVDDVVTAKYHARPIPKDNTET